MSSYKVIIADDHVLVRKGLIRILEGMSELEIIGEANDGVELLNLLKQLTPDMVILDISMPNLQGIEAIPQIKMIRPDARVLILTMHKDSEFLQQAFSSGADGYLLKEDAEKELYSAIEAIREKRIYITPSLAEESREDWVRLRRGDRRVPFVEPLTPREKEVLKLIAEGKSNKEIAGLLFISVHTVERHRANIMDKLDLKKTADLVKYAMQKGYI